MTSLLSYVDGFSEHSHITSRLLYGIDNIEQPVVSIMIPTYNRPQLLRKAIESALAQNTDFEFEVVVVDNNSCSINKDEVLKIVHGFNAPNLKHYRNDQNIGMFGNWNRCIQLARGRWVTILNDDDFLAPEYLSVCLQHISEQPKIRLIGCETHVIDERGEGYHLPFLRGISQHVKRFIHGKGDGKAYPLMMEDYFLHNPHHGSLGVLFDRESAINLGGYNSKLFPSADFIFLTRFLMAYGSHFVKKKLAYYRISDNESQKPEVISGWISQGLKLRLEMTSYINCSREMLNLYSRLMAIETARSGREFWKSDIDINALLHREKLANIPVYIVLHLFRFFLKGYLKIRMPVGNQNAKVR